MVQNDMVKTNQKNLKKKEYFDTVKWVFYLCTIMS